MQTFKKGSRFGLYINIADQTTETDVDQVVKFTLIRCTH